MSFISLLADNVGTVSHAVPLRLHHSAGAGALRAMPPVSRSISAPSAFVARNAGPLGTASAAGRWQWAGATAPPAVRPSPAAAVAAVRIPPLLLEEMSVAARVQCRSLSEIWVEAAYEWLHQHAHEHEPQPPSPAAAALAVPHPPRSWAAIDTVLADLRRSPDSAA